MKRRLWVGLLVTALVLATALPLAGCKKKDDTDTTTTTEETTATDDAVEEILVPDVIGMDIADAEDALGAAGLVPGVETEVFSDTVAFGLVIEQTPAPDTAVGPGDSVDLVWSKGPELVSVPSVIGQYPDEATAILEAAGLAVTEVDIHGPVEPDAGNADIGEIYRQTPAAGEMVPKGTVVEIRYWWEMS